MAGGACRNTAGGITIGIECLAFCDVGRSRFLFFSGLRQGSQGQRGQRDDCYGADYGEKRTVHSNTLRLDMKILLWR